MKLKPAVLAAAVSGHANAAAELRNRSGLTPFESLGRFSGNEPLPKMRHKRRALGR
jgi:hypothetical protein